METAIAWILYGPYCEPDHEGCHLKTINNFYKRKDFEKLLTDIEDHLKKYCYYCNGCEFCNAYTLCHAEMKRMGFWSHNRDKKFWDVYDPLWDSDNDKFTLKPLPNNMNL